MYLENSYIHLWVQTSAGSITICNTRTDQRSFGGQAQGIGTVGLTTGKPYRLSAMFSTTLIASYEKQKRNTKLTHSVPLVLFVLLIVRW
jgi:hypothetical protein